MTCTADELKDMASDWLAAQYPQALIVRELSAGDWGKVMLDIAAITETQIIGIEIKGVGDSTTRLALQQEIYSKVACHMLLLPCPSLYAKVEKHAKSIWPLMKVVEGKAVRVNKWKLQQLPTAPRQLLQALHGKELRILAKRLGRDGRSSVDVQSLYDDLSENVPLAVLRPGVCSMLRERDWSDLGRFERDPKRIRWADGTRQSKVEADWKDRQDRRKEAERKARGSFDDWVG